MTWKSRKLLKPRDKDFVVYKAPYAGLGIMMVNPTPTDPIMTLIVPLIYADDPAGTAMFADYLKNRDRYMKLLAN